MTDDAADVFDRPDECPACGGDVVERAAGAECDDCGARIGHLDSRGT